MRDFVFFESTITNLLIDYINYPEEVNTDI